MTLDAAWPWIALLLLGALHGLNPGMGWLFAVALGMQRGERRAVWRALLPLTAGHALAIATAVLVAGLAGLVIPLEHLPWIIAGALVVIGVRQMLRHRHPRWGGMRVGARDLVIWSFFVATAHGAGLMAVPFAANAGAVTGTSVAHAEPAAHEHHAGDGGSRTAGSGTGTDHHGGPFVGRVTASVVAATVVHTAGYVVMTGLLALVVYQFAGLRLLRTAWVNVDLIWAGVLVATGVALVFV